MERCTKDLKMITTNDDPDRDVALEHLTLIERILDRADRGPRPMPFTFIAWGLTSAAFNLAYVPGLPVSPQAVFSGAEVVMVFAYILTFWEFVSARRRRSSDADVQVLVVFAGMTTVLWVLKWIWLEQQLISGLAFSFMWSLGFAIALLVYGTDRVRPLQIGGITLVCSVFAASLMPSNHSILLAVGGLIGIMGPGIYFLRRRTHG